MYVDVWSHVAQREREVNKIENLCRMKLVKRSPRLTLLITYFKISNATLKQLLKMKVRLTALFGRLVK